MFYKWLSNLLPQLTSCLSNFKYCINDLSESIKLAIRSDDINALDYIIETKVYNNKTILALKDKSDDLLPLCYSGYDKLLFAEKLIKAGAIFNSIYITFAMPFPTIPKLKNHLKAIEFNTTKLELFKAIKIIESMDSAITTTKTNESCIDYLYTLLSITYTDDKNYYNNFKEMHESFINKDNSIVAKLSHLVCHANYPEPEIIILAPIFNDHHSAYHSFARSLIYTPFSNFDTLEKSILIHEQGHYIMYSIFGNNGYPFEKNNIEQIQEYDLAATKTLCKIGEIIGFKCNNETTKGLKSHKVAFDLLHKSFLTIFYYRHVLSNPEVSIELKTMLTKIIKTKFDINTTLVHKYGIEKVLNIEVEKLIQKHNITQDLVLLLERVGEYVGRNSEDDYSSELIVRAPELIVRGLDSHTLSYLEPLQFLWLRIIDSVDIESNTQTNLNYIENTAGIEIAGDIIKDEL